MTYDFSKLAGLSAVLLALVATPVAAQEIGDWDEDADGALSQEEFDAGFEAEGIFGGWDENGDRALDEEEFNAGVFGGYDDDESGAIEEPEFGDAGDDIGDGGLFDV